MQITSTPSTVLFSFNGRFATYFLRVPCCWWFHFSWTGSTWIRYFLLSPSLGTCLCSRTACLCWTAFFAFSSIRSGSNCRCSESAVFLIHTFNQFVSDHFLLHIPYSQLSSSEYRVMINCSADSPSCWDLRLLIYYVASHLEQLKLSSDSIVSGTVVLRSMHGLENILSILAKIAEQCAYLSLLTSTWQSWKQDEIMQTILFIAATHLVCWRWRVLEVGAGYMPSDQKHCCHHVA